MNERQEQRQRARKGGRYVQMPECPRCHKRRALEPAYGGEVVPETSKFAGLFICRKCITAENKSPTTQE